jgi:predicted porin
MRTFDVTKAAAVAATAFAAAAPAFAQSSVTLYGIVDDSIVYQSSQTSLGSTSGGRLNVKLASGIWAGSRFGLKGGEDLAAAPRPSFSWNPASTSTTARSNTRTPCSAVNPGSV